jgi:hypothetical protein
MKFAVVEDPVATDADEAARAEITLDNANKD